MRGAVTQYQMRGAAANAKQGRALGRRRLHTRVGGKTEIVIAAKRDDLATIDTRQRLLRRLQFTTVTTQSLRFERGDLRCEHCGRRLRGTAAIRAGIVMRHESGPAAHRMQTEALHQCAVALRLRVAGGKQLVAVEN